jgi:hypothetical protein
MATSSRLCNNLGAVAFVNKHRHDCMQIANQLNVPIENIIGLAAQESQYGTGRIAREYNNYFSMHAPAPLQIGSAPALGNPKVKVARFSSFLESGQSFAKSKFGSAVRGVSDPLKFAEMLVQSGFNSGKAATGGRDGFAQYLADIISTVKVRMECPQ